MFVMTAQNKWRAVMLASVLLVVLATVFVTYRKRHAVPPVVKHTQEVQVQTRNTIDIASLAAKVDTLNWKTYRNEAYGFEVKYPTSFMLDEQQRKHGFIVGFQELNRTAKDAMGKESPQYETLISLGYFQDLNDPDLSGIVSHQVTTYKNLREFLDDSDHTYIKEIGEISIDGKRSYVLSMPGEIGYEAVMVESNRGFLLISFPWTQKKLDENIKSAFLSSFTFVK